MDKGRFYLPGEILQEKTPAEIEIERLVQQNLDLLDAIQKCRSEYAQMKSERDAMVQAVSGLRKLLAPLWGEVQAVGQIGIMSQPTEFGKEVLNPKIESAKRRMPGKPSEFIDLLLEHGPMNVTNFVTLARCSKQTAYNTLSKLSQAGIVQSSGGKYFLKE